MLAQLYKQNPITSIEMLEIEMERAHVNFISLEAEEVFFFDRLEELLKEVRITIEDEVTETAKKENPGKEDNGESTKTEEKKKKNSLVRKAKELVEKVMNAIKNFLSKIFSSSSKVLDGLERIKKKLDSLSAWNTKLNLPTDGIYKSLHIENEITDETFSKIADDLPNLKQSILTDYSRQIQEAYKSITNDVVGNKDPAINKVEEIFSNIKPPSVMENGSYDLPGGRKLKLIEKSIDDKVTLKLLDIEKDDKEFSSKEYQAVSKQTLEKLVSKLIDIMKSYGSLEKDVENLNNEKKNLLRKLESNTSSSVPKELADSNDLAIKLVSVDMFKGISSFIHYLFALSHAVTVYSNLCINIQNGTTEDKEGE